ncbi:hypothetical protein SAMN05192553_102243 [Cyclobacterium xiamenense]|uniref:Uncharacterized protein n=1 Tax=Cyclobacterium xiamenense TaxID=1297121 RepID=A0A1H6VRC3_9BACT|nr:hypothetical protein SAMN05192553_102243 [Cyclobacterium xiamenense]
MNVSEIGKLVSNLPIGWDVSFLTVRSRLNPYLWWPMTKPCFLWIAWERAVENKFWTHLRLVVRAWMLPKTGRGTSFSIEPVA